VKDCAKYEEKDDEEEEAMHPLVRDLYKRVLIVGQDYPTGLAHVKQVWKRALRETKVGSNSTNGDATDEEKMLLMAIHKGRLAVKEMIGIIQLRKYRSLKQRYGTTTADADEADRRMARLESAQAAAAAEEEASASTTKATTAIRYSPAHPGDGGG
jgi:hypothetical protein